MRVSTGMMYDLGLRQMQSQTSSLLQTQQQISSGRRILTPADDPVAAARALEIRQSQSGNEQFLSNQAAATDRLRTAESRLTGIGDVMQYMRERAVQAGNAALGAQELGYIATDLKAQFDALVSLANSKDAQGDYVFSGFQTDTAAYAGAFGEVAYQGDSNSLNVQVSASRFMPVSFTGDDVFGRARPMDSELVMQSGAEGFSAGLTLADGSAAPDPGVRYVVRYDATDGFVVQRRAPADPAITPDPGWETLDSADVTYDSAAKTLSFPNTAGDTVIFDVGDTPADGEAIEIFVPGSDVFANMAVFIDSLNAPGPSGPAEGAVAFALDALDVALESILRVRAQVGSQMTEIENLEKVGGDLDLQYASEISRLEDLDYAEAISRLSKQQVFLEAAQQTYLRVTGLSLFNYLS